MFANVNLEASQVVESEPGPFLPGSARTFKLTGPALGLDADTVLAFVFGIRPANSAHGRVLHLLDASGFVGYLVGLHHAVTGTTFTDSDGLDDAMIGRFVRQVGYSLEASA